MSSAIVKVSFSGATQLFTPLIGDGGSDCVGRPKSREPWCCRVLMGSSEVSPSGPLSADVSRNWRTASGTSWFCFAPLRRLSKLLLCAKLRGGLFRPVNFRGGFTVFARPLVASTRAGLVDGSGGFLCRPVDGRADSGGVWVAGPVAAALKGRTNGFDTPIGVLATAASTARLEGRRAPVMGRPPASAVCARTSAALALAEVGSTHALVISIMVLGAGTGRAFFFSSSSACALAKSSLACATSGFQVGGINSFESLCFFSFFFEFGLSSSSSSSIAWRNLWLVWYEPLSRPITTSMNSFI
mmetsp:Transcript_23769/g.54790  ORF Transcript_23769/g.54790 Transcript_23769/m.54790 type:complete len:300 (+) Transcript_23769:125-1024(+)